MAEIKARQIKTGVADGDLVELGAGGTLPVVNGAALTNVDAITVGSDSAADLHDSTQLTGTIPSARLTGSYSINISGSAANATTLGGQPVGIGPNDIVALDGSSRLPAVNASLLTNVPPSAFRGALVYRSTSQSIPTGVQTAVVFNATLYDITSIHTGNSSRLTVPTGATMIRLTGQILWSPNASGTQRRALIYKNGAQVWAGRVQNDVGTAATTDIINISSAVVQVTSGDYFEIFVDQDSGVSLSVGGSASAASSWFGMEVVL